MEENSWVQQPAEKCFCLICSVRLKRKVDNITTVSTSRRSIAKVLCDLFGLPDNFTSDNTEGKPFLFCKRCCAKIRQMSKVYVKIKSLHEKFDEFQKEVQATVNSTLVTTAQDQETPFDIFRRSILHGNNKFQEIYVPICDSVCPTTDVNLSLGAEDIDTMYNQVFDTSTLLDDPVECDEPELDNTVEPQEITVNENLLSLDDELNIPSFSNVEPVQIQVIEVTEKNETTTVNRLNCSKCRYTFKDEIGRDAHWKKYHEGKDFPFVCECGKQFKTRRQISIHTMKHRQEAPFICEHCGKGFRMEKLLSYHLQNKHIGGRKFKCSYLECEKEFSTGSKLKIHMLTHSKQWPATCTVCGKGFPHKVNLINHMIVKHADVNPWKCSTCEKSFTSSCALEAHKALHTHQFKFPCSICPLGAPSKSALDRHLLKHQTEKGFNCDICQNKFKYKRSLQKHMKAHEGKKDYKCSLCDKGFLDKYKLHRHIKIHSGNKEFECDICQKKFYTKDYLKKHLNCHEKKKMKKLDGNSKQITQKRKKSATITSSQDDVEDELVVQQPQTVVTPFEVEIIPFDQPAEIPPKSTSSMMTHLTPDLFDGSMFQFTFQDEI